MKIILFNKPFSFKFSYLTFLLPVMFCLVIFDQITKIWVMEHFFEGESIELIAGFFNFTYVKNTGAAFGFMAQAEGAIRPILFLGLPILLCLGIFIAILWEETSCLARWSYTLILSGAIGNLIDRFRMGFVVDFLDFYVKEWHYPAFNVADSCVTIGAILLILESFNHSKKILNS